jgi:hypothetical protein
MNYFLNTWGLLEFILQVAAITFLIWLFLFFFMRLEEKFKLPDWFRTISVVLSIALGIGIGFLGVFLFRYYFADGEIRQLYLVNPNGSPRLTVLLVREESGKVSTWYNPKLKTFDLETGKFIGRKLLYYRSYSDDYDIYGPVGKIAWGISSKTGIQLLDMSKPAVIGNQKEILAKNPQLGGSFELIYGDIYDPSTNGIQVVTRNGNYYRINPDLSATRIKDIYMSSYNRQTYWHSEPVPGRDAETLHYRSASPGPESKPTIFISPQLVREMNWKARGKDKTWVVHYSTYIGDYDTLLSYIDKNGRELNRINLRKMFKNKYVKVLATLTRENDMFVFISVRGYTLSALRTDLNTGKILERINYLR